MNAEHTEKTSRYIFAQVLLFSSFFTEDLSQSLLIFSLFFSLGLELLLSLQLHFLELFEGVASDWH